MCRVISVVNQKGGCSKTTRDTVNYQIEGKKGKWKSLDSVIIDGKEFYLMEHQEYGNQAQKIILDAYGKMIVEECEMFDANAKRKIREYIWQHNPKNQLRQFKRQGKNVWRIIRSIMRTECTNEVRSPVQKLIIIQWMAL